MANSTFTQLEKNKVKITFNISADRFAEGIEYAYKKNRGKINIPGFRKGKAPKQIIESQYGKEVFYEDALNFCLPQEYENAVAENNLEVVSKPEFEPLEIDAATGVIMAAEVFVKPVVVVPPYLALPYPKPNLEVTDEEINARLEAVQKKNGRLITVEDRPAQVGDTVSIDYQGFVDDVAFEGGTGSNNNLVLGSHSFIDTFEDQIVSHSIGESFDVNVTFPQEYHEPTLSGKPAVFKVTLNGISYLELPPIDDDFAKDFSEFDTIAEYKESLEKELAENKAHEAEHQKEAAVMSKIAEGLEADIPECMFESQVDNLVESFARRIQSQGIDLETYFRYFGQSMENLREAQYQTAVTQVKSRLALEEIAKKENITVSDEEYKEELNRLAQAYQMPIERLETAIHPQEKRNLIKDLEVQKALKLVLDSAVEMETI